MGGLVSLLKSRKFWLSVVGVLAAFGLVPADQEAQLADAVVLIVSVLVLAIAGEDVAGKLGKGDDDA